MVGLIEMDGGDWARAFLAVELDDIVPDDIRELFAVARGACVYGWFYYPLFAVAEDQMYRVAEAAASERYRQLEGPRTSRPTFAEVMAWLLAQGVIDTDDEPRWEAVRHLRNISSHPKFPTAMFPGQVLGTVENVAAAVNRLFARPYGLNRDVGA